MAEIPEICVFETIADSVVFETNTNGDKITITNLSLTKNESASLAWLINHDASTNLKFRIKLEGT